MRSALIIAIMLVAIPGFSFAGNSTEESVIYKLYKNYGWEVLLKDPDHAQEFLGKYITNQPRNIINNYFDDNLSDLLVLDQKCVNNNNGDICNLDFDPIFASQDPSAYSLEINNIGNGKIDVQYFYPLDGKKLSCYFLYQRQD